MANRQRAEARRKAQAKAARSSGGTSRLPVVIAAIVVVLIGGGIVFFATRGDDNDKVGPVTTDTLSSLPITQPVTINGTTFDMDPQKASNTLSKLSEDGKLLPQFASGAPDAAVGATAPLLSGLNFQGERITLDPAKGPYMVVFLAHWCPHCNAEVPRMLDWKAQGGVPAELKVIGVATAASAASANYPPANWFSQKGWSWPVIVDQGLGDGQAGVAASAFGASGWPYFVIIGTDGKVKVRYSGEIAIKDLQAMVDSALAS